MTDKSGISKSASVEDPYRTFKFLLKWDGKVVAGFSKVDNLNSGKEIVNFRAGGNHDAPRKKPGSASYEPITLERGVTHDKAFEQWANKVWSYTQGAGNVQGGAKKPDSSLKDQRKDLKIDVFNQAGQTKLSYRIFRCWPSEFTALPELDANSNTVAIETLKLEHEGWEIG